MLKTLKDKKLENCSSINNKSKKQRKIIVGLSGGVDSSLSAALLMEDGWNVEGLTLWLMKGEGSCCSEGLVDAAGLCEDLGINHNILDSRLIFEREVVKKTTEGYESGFTPLPCSMCNKNVKFEEMLNFVIKQKEFTYIATGHYARVQKSTFENIKNYKKKHPYVGSTCGRYANRISQAQFYIKGKKFNLVFSSLPLFQIKNFLIAASAVSCMGYNLANLSTISKKCPNVSGRMEYVGLSKKGGKVYVDFAHTPDALLNVLKEIKQSLGLKKLLVSIAAGVKTSFIQNELNLKSKIIRTMPNLPCLVLAGVFGYRANKNCTSNDLRNFLNLVQTVGTAIKVPKESDFDYVTALSGSGPAFLGEFINCLLYTSPSPRDS